jgi:hypothetical protein
MRNTTFSLRLNWLVITHTGPVRPAGVLPRTMSPSMNRGASCAEARFAKPATEDHRRGVPGYSLLSTYSRQVRVVNCPGSSSFAVILPRTARDGRSRRSEAADHHGKVALRHIAAPIAVLSRPSRQFAQDQEPRSRAVGRQRRGDAIMAGVCAGARLVLASRMSQRRHRQGGASAPFAPTNNMIILLFSVLPGIGNSPPWRFFDAGGSCPPDRLPRYCQHDERPSARRNGPAAPALERFFIS